MRNVSADEIDRVLTYPALVEALAEAFREDIQVPARHLVRRHAAIRPTRRVTLWNRTRSRAVSLAFGLAVGGVETEVTDDLESAVRQADIVSCATLSLEPLIRGAWLRKGAHLDLVG